MGSVKEINLFSISIVVLIFLLSCEKQEVNTRETKVSGIVTDYYTKLPINKCEVYLNPDKQGASYAKQTVTNDTGYYHIDSVRISESGYVLTYKSTGYQDKSEQLKITDELEVYNNTELIPTSVVLSGYVRNKYTEEPIENCRVQFENEQSWLTNADGYFEMKNVEAGETYTLTFDASDYGYEIAKDSITAKFQSSFNFLVYLDSLRTGSIKIKNGISTLSAQTGTIDIEVKSNASWKITSEATWFYYSPTEGKGNDILSLSYAENNTNAVRDGRIKMYVDDDLVSYINLKQSAVLTDYEGNKYNTIVIGKQVWMKENLKSSKYADGAIIPHITENIEWQNLDNDNSAEARAMCFYNNTQNESYGALYTYAAAINGTPYVESKSVQGVCPDGWHLPNNDEWQELIDYVGGEEMAGSKLKNANGISFWKAGNEYATNEYGFNAMPAGYRNGSAGTFYGWSYHTGFWSANQDSNNTQGGSYHAAFNKTNLEQRSWDKSIGMSVRCVKD